MAEAAKKNNKEGLQQFGEMTSKGKRGSLGTSTPIKGFAFSIWFRAPFSHFACPNRLTRFPPSLHRLSGTSDVSAPRAEPVFRWSSTSPSLLATTQPGGTSPNALTSFWDQAGRRGHPRSGNSFAEGLEWHPEADGR